MGWYKEIKAILEREPEIWLSYLHGQQLWNIPHLTRARPRYRGLFFQVAKFIKHLLIYLRVRQPGASGDPVKVVAFFGSLNQKHSLEITIDSIRQRGITVLAIAPEGLIERPTGKQQFSPFRYSLLDVCKALFLLGRRGPALYREVKTVHPIAVSWYFVKFCSAYGYLCAFHRILKQTKPEFVITSNDHNVPNRCLLAVAQKLGIKTVYLQHASVSNLFPALRVDFAFLDGQCALDIYRECEHNCRPIDAEAPKPKILLTGQKKPLTRPKTSGREVIGVALNSLDKVDAAIEFVNDLADAGYAIRVRWHPGQKDRDIKSYKEAFAGYPRVSLSNPKAESVADFMANIGWLIAGNSSIHLEAALSGVLPIYYELIPTDNPDYYGYVKHGLAKLARTSADILWWVENTERYKGPKPEAVRYYSATYLTEWEGREGELVAECLSRISKGEALPVDVLEAEPLGRN